MGKIVFWLIVFFVGLLVVRLINVANSRSASRRSPKRDTATKDTAMTRCVNCGVYLPRADAVESPRAAVRRRTVPVTRPGAQPLASVDATPRTNRPVLRSINACTRNPGLPGQTSPFAAPLLAQFARAENGR